nr:MAG: major core protein [Halyomorpha halys reo-like associated virus 1]
MSSSLDQTGHPTDEGETAVSNVVISKNITTHLDSVQLYYETDRSRWYYVFTAIGYEKYVPQTIFLLQDSKHLISNWNHRLVNINRFDSSSRGSGGRESVLHDSEPVIISTPRIPDDAKDFLFDPIISHYPDLMYYILAVNRIGHFGRNMLLPQSTLPGVALKQGKCIDLDEIKYITTDSESIISCDIKTLIRKIENSDEVSRLLEYLSLRYTESTAASIPSYFVDPDSPITDDASNFVVQTLPVTQDELDLMEVSNFIFKSQFVHPLTALKILQNRLPPTVRLDPVKYSQILNESTPGDRSVSPASTRYDRNLMYCWPKISEEFRSRTRALAQCVVKIKNPSVLSVLINNTIKLNINTQDAGSNLGEYANSPQLPVMISNILRNLINVNLFRYFRIFEITAFSKKIYELYGILIWQIFVPPNTIDLDSRISLNNAILYWILSDVCDDSQRTKISTLIPDIPTISKLQSFSTNDDLLAKLYIRSSVLNHSLGSVGKAINSALKSYFNQATPGEVGSTITIETRGVERVHPVSVICPYLNGPKNYDYTVSEMFREARYNMFKDHTGAVLPTNYAQNEPDLTYYSNKLNFMKNMVSILQPSRSQVSRQTLDTINNDLETSLIGGITQLYYIYYSKQANIVLSVCCDPVVKHNVEYVDHVPIDGQYGLSIPYALQGIIDPLPMEEIKIGSGIATLTRAQIFLAIYHNVSRMVTRTRTDDAQIQFSMPKDNRIGIAIDLTRALLRDPNFNPVDEFVGTRYDKRTLDRFLDTPENFKETDLLTTLFKLLSVMTNQIRAVSSVWMVDVNEFYIVRNSLSSFRGNLKGQSLILGMSTVRRNDLNVVSTINSGSELSSSINSSDALQGSFIVPNKFFNDFHNLGLIANQAMLDTAVAPSIDAIRVKAPARLILHTYYFDKTTKFPITGFTPSKLSDLENAYDLGRKGFLFYPRIDIHIGVAVNDLGSTLNSNAINLYGAILNHLDKLGGSELIYPTDDVWKLFGVKVLRPRDHINWRTSNVTVRSTPFNRMDGPSIGLVQNR